MNKSALLAAHISHGALLTVSKARTSLAVSDLHFAAQSDWLGGHRFPHRNFRCLHLCLSCHERHKISLINMRSQPQGICLSSHSAFVGHTINISPLGDLAQNLKGQSVNFNQGFSSVLHPSCPHFIARCLEFTLCCCAEIMRLHSNQSLLSWDIWSIQGALECICKFGLSNLIN